MIIPWKLKSKIFSLIDIFHADFFLYFLQKYVSKRAHGSKLGVDLNWIRHKNALIDNCCTQRIFEFGAGKSLAQNLFLSTVVENQFVVDINPMIDIYLVNKSKSILSSQVKFRSEIEIKSLNDLKFYGIDYKSPYDASQINLDDKFFDACVSTNTLEHIPQESIRAILKELHRTIKDTGIISAVIDYSDHYAHTDSTISLLNYLNYSEIEWRKYNHNCHFQNRLRHGDYKTIFLESGFDIISETLEYSEENISDRLLKKYMNDDMSWCATSAHFILKKSHFS